MRRYRTKPIEAEASDPLTLENRDEVVEWIRANGAKVEVPEGSGTFLLLLFTPRETPVHAGDRIVLERDNWFIYSERRFDARYESA